MRSMKVEMPGGRRYTLTADRPWTLQLADHELTVIDGERPIDDPATLGIFVHFGGWIFRSTRHRALSQMRLNGAAVIGAAVVRLPGSASLSFNGQPEAAHAPVTSPDFPRRPAGEWRMIGRTGTGADFELDDPTVLARHAEVRRTPDGEWMIAAKRGLVFVNGIAYSSAPIRRHDTVIIGQSLLHVTDLETAWHRPPSVPTETSASGLAVQAIGVHVHNGDRPTLVDLNFDIAPGTLVAVIGPSGAGKSTLLGAVLGGRRITDGELRVGDVRLRPAEGRRLLRHLVRFVPQQDCLYGELTVAETFDGAARLRLAADAAPAERRRRVDDVLTVLRLEHRRHARVDELSGGEQRRASIGIELVGCPHLLLLDEPTSGLDLALDRDLMRTLRRVSRTGCTVIVNTHSVAHLDEADQVLLLNAGGRLVRDGRPDELVATQPDSGWTDLLDSASRRPDEPPPATGRQRRPWLRLPQVPLGRQFTVLLRRGPRYAVGMFALPLGGAAVAAAAASSGLRAGPNLTQVLAILVTVAALAGAALTYLDIVREEGVLKRDWRAGVHPGRIVASLFGAYATVCAVLAILMTATFLWRRDGFVAAFAVPPTVSLLLVLFLLMIASMAIGILISATVRTVPQAVTVNTVVAIAQVVLNGSLFQMPVWLAALTTVLPARLGLAAAASYANLNAQRRGSLYTDALWQPGGWRFWALLGGLVVVTSVALGLATLLLQARWRRTVE